MGNITVYRASAGSGKTHRLTGDYLKMAFAAGFQQILAVTFTNKATAEMKSRILEELYKISKGEASDFQNFAGDSSASSKINASLLLENILQKYAWFSVTTIDSFLSGIFRSFLLEIGVNSVYDIELDQNSVLEKIIDRLFENIEEDTDLKYWLVRFARERIETGDKWEIKKEIQKLGAELFKESYKLIDDSTTNKFSDKNFLNNYRKQLTAVQTKYIERLRSAGLEAMSVINQHSLSESDFKQGGRGIFAQFRKWSSGDISEPNIYVRNCLSDPDEWISKGKNNQIVATLRDQLLMKILQDTFSFIERESVFYNTSETILKHFHTIGILGDLAERLQLLVREENKILLSEASSLLCDVVGENDASFVFEKAGNLYLNFMIDEFQDTSRIQWKTLMPLVKNGISENGSCMIVGDVKQSIYRWRNGDWELLAGRALEDLKPFPNTILNLETNWRSAPQVIQFNNRLFHQAPAVLQNQYNSDLIAAPEEFRELLNNSILGLYEGQKQLVPDVNQEIEGFVRVFCIKKDKDKTPPKDLILEKLPETIASFIDKGFQLKDIAILVRKKSEGDSITRVLRDSSRRMIRDKKYNFDFISDENLYLDESPAVYLLISALKFLARPDDRINLASLLYNWNQKSKPGVFANDDIFMASSVKSDDLKNFLPNSYIENLEHLRQLSLLLLAEELIKVFDLDDDSSETPYLMAFMDQLLQFTRTERGGIAAFLDWWEQNKDNFSLLISENQNAIRVMTFHKSKGLQFRVVIIPFCDWLLDHDARINNIIWCKTSGNPFSLLEQVPVQYSGKLAETRFAPDYFREKQKAYIDNLNLMYVGFTRAEQGLVIFAPCSESEKGLKTTGDLLEFSLKELIKDNSLEDFTVTKNAFEQEGLTLELGEITSEWKKNIKPEDKLETLSIDHYPYYPFTGRLAITFKGEGFFEPQRNETILRGKVMHELFSLVKTKSDIEKAVDLLIEQGKIPQNSRQLIINQVVEYINNPLVEDWFEPGWEIHSEAEIILPGKGILRPDRVMVRDKTAIVVDYKFGSSVEKKYDKQVNEYCELMKEMGFDNVQGYIWYVELSKINRIV